MVLGKLPKPEIGAVSTEHSKGRGNNWDAPALCVVEVEDRKEDEAQAAIQIEAALGQEL